MTRVTAQLNYLRIAPRKVRLVGDVIKGLDTTAAELELQYLVKRGAAPVLKLLKSAVANARNNAKIAESTGLIVRDVRVDEGRAYKRHMPKARGRAGMYKKRTSKIMLILETKE